MKYLENAVKFLVKNWKIALPLYILMVIPALITGTANSLTNFTKVWSAASDPSQIADFGKVFALFGLILPMVVGGGILSFICQFISMPATYGMVNRGLETGNSSLNDIGQAISVNFVKYVMYFVGTLVLWLAFTVASAVLIGIFALIRLYVIVVLLFIIIAVAALVLSVLISFWFSAMVVDNLTVIDAVKKSFEIAKSCFWTIIGITLLVWIAGAILGAILSIFSGIPLLGPIIVTVAPAAVAFIMIVFYLIVYRDKAGKFSSLQN